MCVTQFTEHTNETPNIQVGNTYHENWINPERKFPNAIMIDPHCNVRQKQHRLSGSEPRSKSSTSGLLRLLPLWEGADAIIGEGTIKVMCYMSYCVWQKISFQFCDPLIQGSIYTSF